MSVNRQLAHHILETLKLSGVEELCISPGNRCAPFIDLLSSAFRCYYWPEERSGAFFALGRARRTERPVGIITTSGTAVAELLPAMMEGFYSGVPILAITADRPRRFRESGAPQTANQLGIYSHYVDWESDIEGGERCDLSGWGQRAPAHLNVCFEEPLIDQSPLIEPGIPSLKNALIADPKPLQEFLQNAGRLAVVVSTLPLDAQEPVKAFLKKLRAPVYLESVSGLRESKDLKALQLASDQFLNAADSVLRIGGVPTFRPWRDLETLEGQIEVLSITERPFPGISWGKCVTTDLASFFKEHRFEVSYKTPVDFERPPLPSVEASEPMLIRDLSLKIPSGSHIYLGNSMPIRQWDLAAIHEEKGFEITASRGLNGIDGQLSAFFGLTRTDVHNWAIIGDLTALYDLAAPWILSELQDRSVFIVVVNNGGGKIFERFFANQAFQNNHQLNFSGIADFWGLSYHRWEKALPDSIPDKGHHLIELIPDSLESSQFWEMQKWSKSTLSTVS